LVIGTAKANQIRNFQVLVVRRKVSAPPFSRSSREGGDFDYQSIMCARVDDRRNLKNMPEDMPQENSRGKHITAIAIFVLALTLSAAAFSQTTAPDPKSVPVVDGAVGPCSADFIVTDSTGAAVYAAKINVHIAYRFGSFHKLDLEVSTNADGKARFTGLPDHLKRGLTFYSSEGDRTGESFDDPAVTCKAQFTVALQKKTQ